MTKPIIAVLGSLLLGAAVLQRAAAQNPPLPPPSQAQAALEQAVQRNPGLPDVIRQRVQQSGLTADQIRARLAASGYPPSLLDAYLGAAPPGQPQLQPGTQELAAVQALGLGAITARAESLPVDTGLIRRVESPPSPVFGVDVFRRTTTQFLPLLAGPVPADYRLGPGDVLVLILTGEVELAYTLQVTREGFVLIPQVGQVFVANLTLDHLRDVLYSRLGRVYSGVTRSPNATTRFDVSVANVRVNQVYVVGEVKQPGAYQLSALGTVLGALYAAGGVTERSNMRVIGVRRLGKTVASFDLYDYLLHGDTRSDIRLETGDVVFVPVHGTRAQVDGAVVRPAIYELKPGENLADLFQAAGGFRADAAMTRVTVYRVLPARERAAGAASRTVIDVQLAAALPDSPNEPPAANRGGDDLNGVTIPVFGIEDGDSVVVDALPTNARRNFVDIKGSIYQPGRYGLEPGMTLSGLVKLAGGFRPATYTGRAHIERLNPTDSTRYVIPVELPADTARPWNTDPKLQDYDIVTVYGRPEMRDSVYVAIAGVVNAPGRYPWRLGMTLRDLVLMARGPHIGAYLKEAEIARMPEDRSHGQLAQTIRVPMDSTYLFDRHSSGRYIGPPGMAFPASGAPEVTLDPYDNVLILRQPDFEFQRNVSVLGEVRFPGTYALKSKEERMADVIERAGGLTPQAYAEGVRFVRVVGNAGRIDVDLPRALRDRNSRYDIILQQGDSILVPEYEPSVKVTGAVNTPGSVLWQQGQGLNYYLSAAGGTSYKADRGRASVRYANGQVRTRQGWFLFSSDPRPGPGSEVFVPAKDTTLGTNYVALFGAIAQILVSMVAIIVVVVRHP